MASESGSSSGVATAVMDGTCCCRSSQRFQFTYAGSQRSTQREQWQAGSTFVVVMCVASKACLPWHVLQHYMCSGSAVNAVAHQQFYGYGAHMSYSKEFALWTGRP